MAPVPAEFHGRAGDHDVGGQRQGNLRHQGAGNERPDRGIEQRPDDHDGHGQNLADDGAQDKRAEFDVTFLQEQVHGREGAYRRKSAHCSQQKGELGMQQQAAFRHQLPDPRQQKEAGDGKHEKRQKQAPHHLQGPCRPQEIRSQAATFFDDVAADAQVRQHGQACGDGEGQGHEAEITGNEQARHDKAGAEPYQGFHHMARQGPHAGVHNPCAQAGNGRGVSHGDSSRGPERGGRGCWDAGWDQVVQGIVFLSLS